jgi:hypothetical protein
MTVRFAYINPLNGETAIVDTRDELVAQIAQMAVDTYINHYTNGGPFTFVETLEDGSEKWYSPTGEERLSPDQIKAEAERRLRHFESFANAGVIPTTTL